MDKVTIEWDAIQEIRGTEVVDGGLFAVDGFIREVGETAELPETAEESELAS